MHFKEYGDIHKPLILLIHGGGVGGWMWDKQVQYFSDYHCVVQELIDNGAKNNSDFSIEDSAKTLLSLIEEKAKNKCVIVLLKVKSYTDTLNIMCNIITSYF